MLVFLLRSYLPDHIRHAHKSIRHADEEPPPAAEAVGEAIRRLEPVPPDNPHLLMAPDELASALECADLLNGELPHWHRGRPDMAEPIESPIDEGFERRLEAAKRKAASLPLERPEEGSDDAILA
jgi:hypothetical protein